jgi:hypothetical protein
MGVGGRIFVDYLVAGDVGMSGLGLPCHAGLIIIVTRVALYSACIDLISD